MKYRVVQILLVLLAELRGRSCRWGRRFRGFHHLSAAPIQGTWLNTHKPTAQLEQNFIGLIGEERLMVFAVIN